MMKKIKKVLGIIGIAAIIGFSAIACDNETTTPSHSHTWGEWVETNAATCTAEGVETQSCACGATQTQGIDIDPDNHDMQLYEGAEVILAPTCTQNGIGETACAHGCGKTEEDGVLLALGHHYVATGVVHTAATCTTAGSEEMKCNNLDGECGDIIEGEVIPALTHLWIDNWEITKQPTCTANGDRYRICDRLDDCEERETQLDTINVHALDHDWKYDAGATVQTCTQAGSGARSCQRVACGATSTGGTYPALDHLWIDNWVITKETCLENGDRYRICDRFDDCEERETQTNTPNVPPLGHEWLTQNWVITKHLTCLENGDRERECNRTGCSVKEIEDDTDNLPAYGLHHYTTTPPTCTTASVPHNCGRQLQNSTGNYICGNHNPETPAPALGHEHGTSGTGSLICKRDHCDHQYAIGDTGPAGGIIFYVAASGLTVQGYGSSGDNGYFAEYTAYYLEAAPANETKSYWQSSVFNENTLIDGITTWGTTAARNAGLAASIGVGRKDTQTIVNSAAFAELSGTAAQRCASKTLNGFTDWFLPSLGELNEMYKANGQTGIPTTEYFWSSSQDSIYYAWDQHLGGGAQSNRGKHADEFVRAIRAF